MSDLNERIREQLMTIQKLNHKIQALEAQLGGSHRRGHEMGEKVTELEKIIASKDLEISTLKGEIEKYRAALDTVGKEVKDYRAEQAQTMAKKQEPSESEKTTEELAIVHREVLALKEDLRLLSTAAMGILNKEPEAMKRLQEVLMESGDTQTRVLNLILTRRSIRLEEIASFLVIDVQRAFEIVDALQAAGQVEMKDEHTVIPAAHYRETKIPKEDWEQSQPAELFDKLEEIIGQIEGHEGIVKALEVAVDILEQKLSRGGSLIFEMRKTAGAWQKKPGDIEELRYQIREWKGRALSLA